MIVQMLTRLVEEPISRRANSFFFQLILPPQESAFYSALEAMYRAKGQRREELRNWLLENFSNTGLNFLCDLTLSLDPNVRLETAKTLQYGENHYLPFLYLVRDYDDNENVRLKALETINSIQSRPSMAGYIE